MNPRNFLLPEYLLRPTQILRRLAFRPHADAVLTLPWNCTITASSAEDIGRAIATQGVYDLPVTEALLRLTDPGDTALDIGANIGYMTLVLALAAGHSGRVLSFEPNPRILPTLRANVEAWKHLPIAAIQIETIALSDRDGEAFLSYPPGHNQDSGVATLGARSEGIPVATRRIDGMPIPAPALIKIDVEGHEAAVLAGAQNLLVARSVRDIVFEEHQPYPALSHRILLDCGYRVFRLTRSAWRPLLPAPESASRDPNAPSNFLATADPSRAEDRFRRPGWRALRAP